MNYRKLLLKMAFATLAILVIVSCNRQPKSPAEKLAEEIEAIEKSVENSTSSISSNKKIYQTKSGYLKYNNNAAGIEMTRELWFDDYGSMQYEESYMDIMGTKAGGCTLVRDGYRYSWSYDSSEGTKSKFYAAVSDYDNISKEDIERYGIKKHGNENILGRSCLVVTTEKPVKSKSWMWKGLALKSESEFGGTPVVFEAIVMNEDAISSDKFALPENVTFTEL